MKRAVAITCTLAALVLTGCKTATEPQATPALRTEVGDGIWLVGNEIAPGTWEPRGVWPTKTNAPGCVWFVSPADATPSVTTSKEPTYRDDGPLIIQLHEGETFTTVGCRVWEQID